MIISTAVTLLAFAYVSHAAIAVVDHPIDSCSHLTTCTNCTRSEAACHWSVDRQTCVPSSTPATGKPIAIESSDCPRVWVVDRTVTRDEYKYRVRVADDRIGLLAHLRDHADPVVCVWETDVRSPGRVVLDTVLDGGGEIVCDTVQRSRFGNIRDLPYVRHFRVTFGTDNVTLRMDDDADYYTAFYHSDCGGTLDDRCVNCLWTDNERRYYLKACSSTNVCAVQPSMKLVYVNSQYLKDAGGNGVHGRGLAWPADVRARCDRDIAVVSFEPARVAWNKASPTTMTVRVKNLAALAERFFVWEVTVAGKRCSDIRLLLADGDDRVTDVLTCRLSPGRPVATVASGPVRLRFVSATAGPEATAATVSFVVESAHAFHVDGPTVTGVTGPACGSVRGGATLTVTGTGFDASGNVSVFVHRATAGGPRVPCAVTERADGRVTCVTGPTAAGPAGPLTVAFDAGLVLHAPGAAFAYAADPVPAAAQTLSGIAAGGTALSVRWRGIACVDQASLRFYAQRHDGRRHFADCVIVDATLAVCRAPDVLRVEGVTLAPGPYIYPVATNAAPAARVERFGCGFEMLFAGRLFHVPCGPATAYHAYANPMYAGFELGRAGSAVVIVGRDSGLGYGPGDVAVLLPLREPVQCDIWNVARDRIECWPPETVRGTSDLAELKELWVTVGNASPIVVPRLDSYQFKSIIRDN